MKKIKIILAIFTMIALVGSAGSVKANTAATIASGATNSSITIERKVTGATSPVTCTFKYTVATVTEPGTVGGTTTFKGEKSIAMSAQALSSGTATKTTSISLVGATFS